MILVKLLIIFFIYLILAHIFSLHAIIEGVANVGDGSSKPDLSANYQENSSVSNTEQATTSKQAGSISALQKTSKQLKKDIKDMKNQMTKMNNASASNASNLDALKSDKCSTPTKIAANSKTT